MPEVPRHIIKRQKLVLSKVRREDAAAFQEEVRRIFYQDILPLIDTYCTAVSPNGIPYRIDCIELDLGKLDFRDLRSGILQQIATQLEAAFEPHLGQAEANAQLSAPGKAGSVPAEELLDYFVTQGHLPWWHEKTDPDPVAEALSELMENRTRELTQLLSGWATRRPLLERLFRAVPFPLFLRLLARLLGEEPARFEAQMAELETRLLRLPGSSGYSPYQWRERIGVSALQLALTLPPTNHRKPAYWRALLLDLAGWLRRPYARLLNDLARKTAGGRATASDGAAARPNPPAADQPTPWAQGEQRDWDRILDQLTTELARADTGATRKVGDDIDLPDLLQRLRQQATTRLPADTPLVRAIADRLRRADVFSVTPELIRELDDELLAALNEIPQLSKAIQKWQHRLLIELEPKSVARSDRRKLWEALRKQRETGRVDRSWVLVLSRLIGADKGAVGSPVKSASTTQSERPASPEKQTTSVVPKAFDQSKERFINNAGLVILWPFLPRFFAALGWLEGQVFLSEDVAHRAVGMLQFLADGQREPREYDCVLNKILCGRPEEEVLRFGAPVWDGEAEEAEVFLQAVIANAPVLKNMSADGFRGSFLLREGILRPGSGVWQLYVERATYDIVLDQFPWSWSFVKLPWMEAGIEVIWEDRRE